MGSLGCPGQSEAVCGVEPGLVDDDAAEGSAGSSQECGQVSHGNGLRSYVTATALQIPVTRIAGLLLFDLRSVLGDYQRIDGGFFGLTVDSQLETFRQQRPKPQRVPIIGSIGGRLRDDVVSFRIEPRGSGDLSVRNAIGSQDAIFQGGLGYCDG